MGGIGAGDAEAGGFAAVPGHGGGIVDDVDDEVVQGPEPLARKRTAVYAHGLDNEFPKAFREAAANARLIGAATMMAEALAAVIGHGYCEIPGPSSQDYVSKAAIAKVRAALAKAGVLK